MIFGSSGYAEAKAYVEAQGSICFLILAVSLLRFAFYIIGYTVSKIMAQAGLAGKRRMRHDAGYQMLSLALCSLRSCMFCTYTQKSPHLNESSNDIH